MLGVGDQRGVGVAHLRDAVFRRERVGAVAIAGGDRADDRLARLLRAGLITADGAMRAAPRMPIRTSVHRAHCKVGAPTAATGMLQRQVQR